VPAVFVYGTLTDPVRARSVFGTPPEYVGEALLCGLRRVDGRYPTLVPGRKVRGRLLRTADLARLDRYEGVERGLYVRVTVPRADGRPVEVYVGDPTRLGVDAEWPGDGPFGERVERYVEREDVLVRTVDERG
jgi:gamma-glutamylcyclotransferase (GGCT)/AIG2-like uncharacterized protein YtfP